MNIKVTSKLIEDGGDTLGAALVIGVWGEIVPVVLGLLGIGWFVLRFINFIRVNFLNRITWGMK